MKIITYGHRYELENFEVKDNPGQELQFIEKEKTSDGTFETVNDGTTNEEVILMLIDRIGCLDNKFPCAENKAALGHLQGALAFLEKRTRDRQARKVEGTPNL